MPELMKKIKQVKELLSTLESQENRNFHKPVCCSPAKSNISRLMICMRHFDLTGNQCNTYNAELKVS